MTPAEPPQTPPAVRFVLVPVAVALLLAGVVWLAVARLAPAERGLKYAAGVAAFALTAFVIGRLTRRRSDLRWPVRAAVWTVAVAAVGVVYTTSVRDTVVSERVAVAAPIDAGTDAAATPPASRSGPRTTTGERPQGRNVELRSGRVSGADGHAGEGTARVIRLAEGGRVLTLTEFDVDPAPDVLVYLTPDPATTGGDIVDLGGLKGNRGDQQYAIPDDVDLSRHDTLVIWCRAFSVRIAVADLA